MTVATQEENIALILKEANNLQLESIPVEEPRADEVQIRMKYVGICGSDVHYWVAGRIGDFVLKAPMILGHEGSGVVHKLGANVTHLKVGDRVAIEPGKPCRHCSSCSTGTYNLCKDMEFCATPPVDGNLRTFYNHPASLCFPLPDTVSLEEGAFVEPLAVGVHACMRAGILPGDDVLILGAGPIGCVTALAARAMGANRIVVTDVTASRLDFIKGLVNAHTINVMKKDPSAIVAEIETLLGGGLPRISVECSGQESSMRTAVFGTQAGGTIVAVGMGKDDVSIPIVHLGVRELSIRGVFRYANAYPRAISLLASGAVKVQSMITHRFAIKDAIDAFKLVKSGAEGVIKVLIEV
ncbi:putative sorbitol dehydrogenase [Powellomyces hirtus]|nr:putative sorbitol dehydrogenase [Powellomyces hirtus]